MSQTLNEISVYDSKPSWTGVFPRKAIEQIAALICSDEKQFTLNFQPVQVQMTVVFSLSLLLSHFILVIALHHCVIPKKV